ncbi:hypothetical protein [Methylocystis sp. ATCC 49242]|uniref:hypothetical protein n=1 Tax=Methylocystis sp. ATCC 49242 TaxID=622637 RepID=UPI00030F70B8|nr:hypothetical protein [Methylocystis sp. ATCC 49242]
MNIGDPHEPNGGMLEFSRQTGEVASDPWRDLYAHEYAHLLGSRGILAGFRDVGFLQRRHHPGADQITAATKTASGRTSPAFQLAKTPGAPLSRPG